jgi:hypothetical protein
MEIPKDKTFESKENPNDVKEKELESQGWQKASPGIGETTHMTPFDVDSGTFKPKEVRTEEEIKQEYLDKFGEHGFDEVLLVPSFKFLEHIGWVEEKYHYDVYLRRPQDKKE